jgi:arginyl-tRNA--protein-N-Asp/Glu arginylyltransferase
VATQNIGNIKMKFGLTQPFSCSYLPEQKEQLLVFTDTGEPDEQQYELLIGAGFRRSGEQIYRPHCSACHACQAIRIPVSLFAPSKSQKRVLKRNQDLKMIVSESDGIDYYPLYEQYINQRHHDGSMYPATMEQYQSFIKSRWASPLFIEFYLMEKLVAVAVTDQLPHSLSALYTFFAPHLAERSIGTLAILQQISLAARLKKQFLYLGYQVDECKKMNYKVNFLPHERFFANKWQLITNNTG